MWTEKVGGVTSIELTIIQGVRKKKGFVFLIL